MATALRNSVFSETTAAYSICCCICWMMAFMLSFSVVAVARAAASMSSWGCGGGRCVGATASTVRTAYPLAAGGPLGISAACADAGVGVGGGSSNSRAVTPRVAGLTMEDLPGPAASSESASAAGDDVATGDDSDGRMASSRTAMALAMAAGFLRDLGELDEDRC